MPVPNFLKTLTVPGMKASGGQACDALDRAALVYLVLPLVIFLAGWLHVWAAAPLLVCVAVAVLPALVKRDDETPVRWLRPAQLIAITVGCVWTVLGGTDHFVYANADWHIRDAVLHDLVNSGWPVGYGPLIDTSATLLRTTVAYFLPAALIGKLAGLPAAHFALMVWTATGVSLFLLQVLSLLPSRRSAVIVALSVIVFFSGMDVLGNFLDWGTRFTHFWTITSHLEWWAIFYQYSSLTTQLFWVPNHALGGWLAIGLLARHQRDGAIDVLLPIVMVAVMLWSPLTAIGLLPFVLWKAVASMLRERSWILLHPLVWAPALAVGIVIAGYLTLDSGGIDKGLATIVDMRTITHQAQFFLLEAGVLGFIVLLLRPSWQVGLALAILAILPSFHLGPSNDLVMRASIPSLAVLAIGACLALLQPANTKRALLKKSLLVVVLLIGAETPLQEIARSLVYPRWPVNFEAGLIGASCGVYPAHYVARYGTDIGNGALARVMPKPYELSVGKAFCLNPGSEIMVKEESR